MPVAAGIDRAPEELAAGTPQPLRADLGRLLGEDRVLPRALDLVRYASDASPYRLLPKAVVRPRHAGEVAALLGYARREGIPVTLRAAGTSLNGQAQGDGILVDVRRHFSGVGVEEGGALARVRPGTVLAHANRVLARHGRKLGPDPASHEAATIGGVIANNSGGMRCGVVHDSYSTVRSLSFVLPSGTQIDSAATGAEERFAEAEPELARGLAEIRDEIRADAELSERIARKFAIKNTTGYRLCAFLDAETPLEIFRRLLVGSEGTLAFVSEAVFETIPLRPQTTTAWVHFEGIDARNRTRPRAGRRRGERRRADGRTGADGRQPLDPRDPRALARAAPHVRRPAGRVPLRRRRRSRRTGRLRRQRCSPAARRSARSSSPAIPRRSRCTGGCARACSDWSAWPARRTRS